MANYFNLILDTTAPSNPTVLINGGATYALDQVVNLTIGTEDSVTTGYQMKIWGDVDTLYDNDVKDAEGASNWITYKTTHQIKLSAGDGLKTIRVKIRDDVHNASSVATDSINLDTDLPIVSITANDVSKISKIAGKNICSFGFQSDTPFKEYKVKFVSTTNAPHDTGVQIGVTNGSTNMSGLKSDSTTFPANTIINCSINGSDLELANAGDGTKIIKVFVKDEAGNWST